MPPARTLISGLQRQHGLPRSAAAEVQCNNAHAKRITGFGAVLTTERFQMQVFLRGHPHDVPAKGTYRCCLALDHANGWQQAKTRETGDAGK